MIDSILHMLGLFSESDHLMFKSPFSLWIFLGVAVGVVALIVLFYQRTTVPVSLKMRSLFIALKILPILLIIFCLLEPVAVTSEVTPQQGFLLTLFDDSKSMRIQDSVAGVSRIDAVKKQFQDQSILQALGDRFKVRTFHFSEDIERIADLSSLNAEGNATDIATALNQVASEFRDMPVAGIVLVSDGADNANFGSNELANVTAYLKSQKVPVYTVGVGEEQVARDIEVLKVATSKTVTTGSVTDLFVTVRSFGYAGRTVNLKIKEGGRIVRTEQIRLGQDGNTQRIKLSLSPDSPGIFEYTAEIETAPSEMIEENNQRRFLVDNRSKTARILYVEGYPRKEFKFIRRALEDDTQTQLVSLVRISPDGRLYRQGIESADELRHGYPVKKEELFTYDAIIFGDIEATWFTPDQLAITEEFVSVRGGGFLMLGGDQSFQEGGYTGTPIEDLLPVRLHASGGDAWGMGIVGHSFHLGLTPDGRNHALMRLDADQSKNIAQWDLMPELTGYNRVGLTKPGASVLAIDPAADLLEGSNVILAIQRYGKGRSMAFTAFSSWRWQMLMESTDQSHERFWQQTARWLALSSPGQVTVALDKETYGEHEAVTITSHVFDNNYEPMDEASVWAQVTGPTGQSEAVQLDWAFGDEGTYRAEYQPEIGGIHQVEVSVRSPETIAFRDQTGFSVAASVAEYTDATLHADVLKRLSESTGGAYVPLEDIQTIADQIPPVKQTTSTTHERDLRDTTPLFSAIFLFLGVEWFLRRRKGLS
jgi:uncharacterized membrane protein